MKLDTSFPAKIARLKENEIFSDKEEIIPELCKLLVKAVKSRVSDKVGIAFSGGVDSTLLAFICEKLGVDFTLYAVGFEDSKDMVSAREVAQAMNWKLKTKVISLDKTEDIFKTVMKITNKKDVISVGVGAVTYSVLEMMEEDILLTGLGSEEIFAGYERHKGNINEECWKGLNEMWDRDLQRDLPLVQHFGKQVQLPFLDRKLIEYAMKIKGELKVGEFRKQILREAAVELGAPKEFAFRKKCAAQYGSKFDYAIEKLAKKKGLNKREYLLTL